MKPIILCEKINSIEWNNTGATKIYLFAFNDLLSLTSNHKNWTHRVSFRLKKETPSQFTKKISHGSTMNLKDHYQCLQLMLLFEETNSLKHSRTMNNRTTVYGSGFQTRLSHRSCWLISCSLKDVLAHQSTLLGLISCGGVVLFTPLSLHFRASKSTVDMWAVNASPTVIMTQFGASSSLLTSKPPANEECTCNA